MENRFKLRISRMFRSSFGSCRTRKISDVIEKPIFTPQNHKNTVPLFDPSPSPPPKPKPFPSICKPRRSESTQTAVNHDCAMVTHKETIPRRRKTNTARCYYPAFVSSAVTGGYHHPMSPLNFFSYCKDFEFYEKKKTVTRHKTKTKKKKRVYHVHHKTNNNTTPFFFSSSSRESANYGGPWWWLSSEEDETETLFSSMNLSSDSSESISARRIRPRSNRKNCNNPRRRKAKNSSCDNDNNNKVKDSFAVVKRSSDPYNDFRTSMVEMIVERQIFAAEDLEQLLQCFLSLNSHHHHGRMAAAEQFQAEYEDEEEMVEIKPSLFTMTNPHNREPNYRDPDWFEKVTDWDEFWNHTRWDLESASVEDDDFDVSNAPLRGRYTRTHERVHEMLAAFKAIEGRSDVANLLTAQSRREHIGVYDDPPVDPETQPELPEWHEVDWRAFAEKQRQKDLMDVEWHRRQSKIGKLTYPHKDVVRDVRMRAFDYLDETFDWSQEDMYSLITQGGTAAKPEDHKAWVENPLVPVDYVNVMGVTHIEETEDFLERIGHLGTPQEMQKLTEEEMDDIIDHAGPEVARQLVEPTLRAMEMEEEEAIRRAEGNTWMP